MRLTITARVRNFKDIAILSESGISKTILWIAVFALTIRLVYIVLNSRPLFSDELDYQKLAVTLATEHRYAIDSIPTAYRPIGYPAFIALIYLIGGFNPVIVRIFQAILDSSVVLLLPLLIPTSTARTKLFASMCWALFPPAILLRNLLMTETLHTTVVVCAAALYVQSESRQIGRHILLGLVFGILSLIKPASGFFLLALVLFEWLHNKSWTYGAIIGLTCLLVVLPWAVRNWIAVGEPTLATNSGMNFFIGNNPNANGSYTSRIDAPELVAATDESARDKLAFRMATSYVFAHPGKFLVNGIRKFAHLFSSESFLLVSQFHKSPADLGIPLSRKYADISPIFSVVVNVTYFVLLIFGWLGFLTTDRNRLTDFFLMFLGSLLFVHLITFGGNRFHFPLMPFLQFSLLCN